MIYIYKMLYYWLHSGSLGNMAEVAGLWMLFNTASFRMHVRVCALV
jgi:hypothetical protein